MTKHIEFYFDFGSPTAYLAYCRLGQLAKQYGLAIQYRPMLLGGVFKGAANTSPITVPAKGKYMLEQDLPRFARRYDVPLNFNPHFPINTLNLIAKTAGNARRNEKRAAVSPSTPRSSRAAPVSAPAMTMPADNVSARSAKVAEIR